MAKNEEIVYGKNILNKNLDEVMHESMMPYSEHVILDRALPRVEDGLKPVQRRILYTLDQLGITPDKEFKKSARIVGECLGKYHPHGDTSVYDAMVRLAQPFNMRMPLVEGQGNFGSVDGDDAAAMRYTEARMAPLALEMLKDLEKNTVEWQLNFDDSLQEPVTLPCKFPNLLVNGASGIAVGLATNIPTHNLAEVINGAVALIDNRNITTEELMKYIKAPDFPTGGYIIAGDELKQAYETGKGKIYIRSKVHLETNSNGTQTIVITELPYQVNKAKLMQRIVELKEAKRDESLVGISEVADESDKQGMRATIKLRKDADPQKILDYLFKYTDMQVSFGINMVAIADGRPKQMGIKTMLQYYVDYQRDVIYRRTRFDLDAAKEREHILKGLIIAVRNIDEVVAIIKRSANTTEAKQKLRERFELSDRQAQAILDMRLARLTSLEVYKLEQELLEVQALITKLSAIVASKKLQFEIVKEEMQDIKKRFKEARKTEVLSSFDDFKIADGAAAAVSSVEKVYVCATAAKTIKMMPVKKYVGASKVWGERSSLAEVIVSKAEVMSDQMVLVITNLGNAIKLDLSSLSNSAYKDKGTPLSKIIKDAGANEYPVGIFEYPKEDAVGDLLFFTSSGMIKKTSKSEYTLLKSFYQAAKLKDGDQIIKVEEDVPNTTLLFVTSLGMALNAAKDDIPLQGRISAGVKGIMLADGDQVVSVDQVTDDGEIAVVTNTAYAKRVIVSEIDKMARYRKGVKIISLLGKDSSGTAVVMSGLVGPTSEIVIISDGEISCLSSRSLDEDVRTSRGRCISVTGIKPTGGFVRNN